MSLSISINIFWPTRRGKKHFQYCFLKYMKINDYKGTFNINCKALFILKKPVIMKQLIIDEVPFHF